MRLPFVPNLSLDYLQINELIIVDRNTLCELNQRVSDLTLFRSPLSVNCAGFHEWLTLRFSAKWRLSVRPKKYFDKWVSSGEDFSSSDLKFKFLNTSEYSLNNLTSSLCLFLSFIASSANFPKYSVRLDLFVYGMPKLIRWLESVTDRFGCLEGIAY